MTFMALAGNEIPHFTTIASFIRSLRNEIAPLFTQVLYLCDRQGLIGREHFAIDGVKLPSNASKTRSGTRAEFTQQAVKLEREVKKMLVRHRDNDARDMEPDQQEKERQCIDQMKQEAKALRGWLKANPTERTGMRIMECLRLRVKDVDFERNEILIREGQGFKDRITMLPASLSEPLWKHLQRVRLLHEADLRAGHGEVFMPDALARKYPAAGKSWSWQYVFPSARISKDRRSTRISRHHADEKAIQRAMRSALHKVGIHKTATPTRYVIPLPHTCCRAATTFVLWPLLRIHALTAFAHPVHHRNYWVIKT